MRRSRPGAGEMIAAVGGVALLAFMFLPWLGVESEVAEVAERFAGGVDLPTTNAWESLTFLDLGLGVVGVVALVPLLLAGGGVMVRGVWASALLVTLLGLLAAATMAYRIANPIDDREIEYGMWLGLGAALMIAVGGLVAVRANRA